METVPIQNTETERKALFAKIDKLKKRIKELEAEIEYKNGARKSQGEECERRHNILCRVKEVIDEYFEQALKG